MSDVCHTTLDVPVPGAAAAAFLVLPAGPIRGAVVVVHEIFGRAPEMERVCLRLAGAGYAAILPDLFGTSAGPSTGFSAPCVRRALAELKRRRGPGFDALLTAADVVADRAGVARKDVGIIGFCLGGGFALALGHAFKVTSSNYGEAVPPEALVGIGPTVACFGTRDRLYRGRAEVLRSQLTALGVPHEIKVYDAGHAFLADGDHPTAAFLTRLMLDVDPPRDAAAREAGWQDIFRFFDQHLAVPAPNPDDVVAP